MYSLPLHVHKHQLYLLEQHSESFEIGQQLNWIYIEGNSLIMKLDPVYKDYDSFLFFELL